MADDSLHAFGAPGLNPRWTSSAKVGLGTAYHTACLVWFTLSHGIVNEIYYPTVDTPNTRDLQFLITDGETFCHEEKRDLTHQVEILKDAGLSYRLTNTDPAGRYRIIKEVLADPHHSVLLQRVRLEILDQKLNGRLRIYVLLAPHVGGKGANNLGSWCELSTGGMLHAQRAGTHLVLGVSTGFLKRSVGYVGSSDGWQDLRDFKMDWEFREAGPGNIALTGEIRLDDRGEFTLGVGFGQTDTSAVTALLQSFAIPFAEHQQAFARQWARTESECAKPAQADAVLTRLSRAVLMAHEDKTFQGAMVASLSIPWGEIQGDEASAGYHLVWTRDLFHSASALLATGHAGTPLRALIWLAATQNDDGSFPQNSWIDGKPYWTGIQLDETAAPLLLAWHLKREQALGLFDPWPVLAAAATFLISSGPITGQDRWEENAGFSPSTLATIIAGLVAAAEFADERSATETGEFMRVYADWLNAHVETWTVTTQGALLKDVPRHYIRITPADPLASEIAADPNGAIIEVKNGGGRFPAREVVSTDFLQLVRYGIRAARDPLVVATLRVIDQELKHDLPGGPGWRRYSHDGYGQKANGEPYDGTGVGRCWPILTGERAHYAIAAGEDAKPLVAAMESFANEGGLLPEQIWDEKDSPDASCRWGAPTGAAMPLCWSHAEYINLKRSQQDGKVFDRVEPAYRRYVQNGTPSRYDLWSPRYRSATFTAGKGLRLIVQAAARVHWTADAWRQAEDLEAKTSGLPNLWFVDLPTEALPKDSEVEFTFFWIAAARWEGVNFTVKSAAASDQARR